LRLSDLGFVGRGKSKHRPRNDSSLYGGVYPFVQTGDVKDADLWLTRYSQTYNEVGLAQSKLWPKGTLCITIAANIAETAILGVEACFPDSIVGFIPDDTKADARFIKYYVETIKLRMQNASRGTTQDNLSVEKLLSFDLLVPHVRVQHQIADILSAYDDLIENNARRINALEQMARMLYRKWFVNFRFPDHEKVKFVKSEMGDIPDGWRSCRVCEAVEIDPTTKVPREGLKPFVPMGSLSANSMLITEIEYREGNGGSKFRNGDTLFARITPCLENGKTGFVQFLPAPDAVAFGSTEFIVLRSRTLCPEYVYLMARSDEFRDNAIKSMSGATGRQRVQPGCFQKFLVAQPPEDVLRSFQSLAAPMFRMIQMLNLKNEILRKTRDLLLPKLVSGEVSVEQIEAEVPAQTV
jgi:type I restriction enzyme, S subunit